MSDTINFIEELNKNQGKIIKPSKRLNESAFENKRVPLEDIETKGYQYFSTHGIGPGTLPNEVHVKELDVDLPAGWVTFKTDRPLTQEELDKYDIQPETKNTELRKRFGLNESNNSDDIFLYMNTWKNYNENGADLEKMYGIKNGWMNLEQAKKFIKEYSEDEPFINDTENVPWSIDEYDNAIKMIDYIEKYNQVDDKEALKAIIEELEDVGDAFDTYERGDYIFFPDVKDEVELAKAYIDFCGGISTAIPKDRLSFYIDEEAYRESYRELAEERVREDYPEVDEDSDEFDNLVNKLMDDFTSEDLLNIYNPDAYEDYFDYQAFGTDLEIDGGYFYASTGAISTQ